MTQPPSSSGRHRVTLRRSPVLWAEIGRMVRRPSHRGLVKTAGCLLAAVGVVSAWSAPVASPALALGDTPRVSHTTTSVTAPAAAVAQPESFGEIGFSAEAKPKPKPKPKPKTSSTDTKSSTTDDLLGDRGQDSVSRGGIRTSGLRNELGLTQNGLVVLNAIRDNFPQVSSFGGFRAGDMDHGTGTAVDAMMPSRATGDQVASYVIANASRLNVKYVIWYQRIWYPSSGTWKSMSDRGGITQNHMDHVHVSVN